MAPKTVSRPDSKAGPSRRPLKVIEKTTDLLRDSKRAKGKGKARESLNNLPELVHVERFAEIRALEIQAFQNAIKSAASQGSSRVFQSLPRHLRRRAASHNPKRVPKRLRSKAASEIAPGDNAVKIYRKKAKIRAKGNLRGESRTEQLLRRQRDKKWLKTHLYHAKRFHMVNLWGYRLPLTPTLKSFRPAYRASKRKCVAMDVSYYGIIELEGSREDLVSILGSMTGGPFAGQKYENGRMAETSLYHPHSFPQDLIGPVQIIWHHSSTRLWIQLHPAIFDEVWECLPRIPSVQMRDLRDQLGTLELVGPESGTTMRRIFRVCKDDRRDLFATLGDPKMVPRGTTMSFKVHDPRLHFPPGPVTPSSSSSSDIIHPQPASSSSVFSSGLWDLIERASKPTFKKSELDRRRQKLGLPGTKLHPTPKDDRFHILITALEDRYLLQYPVHWSMPILQSIVYTGALLGGLRERKQQNSESGQFSFPEHYAATCKAGTVWEEGQARKEFDRWSRKPPGKRIAHPTWKPDWKNILNSGAGSGMEEEEVMNQRDIEPWLWPWELKDHLGDLEAIHKFRKARGMQSSTIDLGTCLVPVKIDAEEGSPVQMAEIGFSRDEGEEEKLKVIGYAIAGGFSLSEGHGAGIGMISLTGWQKLEGGEVKYRNPGGIWRSAILTIA